VPKRGNDAQWQADGKGEDKGHDAQLQCGGQALGNDLVDAPVRVLERWTEVTADEVVDPAAVLLPDGLVEVVLGFNRLGHTAVHLLLARPRPPRNQVHEREGDE